MHTTKSPPKNKPDLAMRESAIVATLLEANAEDLPPKLARMLEHAPQSFDDQRHGQIAAAIRRLKRDSKPVHVASVVELVKFEGATIFISQLVNAALPVDLAEIEAGPLWQAYQARRTRTLLAEGAAEIEASPKAAANIAEHVRVELGRLNSEHAGLRELLEERRFKANIEPPPLRAIYTLAGICISTPANLTTITSAIKTGKSAVIGAMAAAAMLHSQDADLLGFNSANPKELALLWFDSEQSPDDFWYCVYRAIQRAGLREKPAWLLGYCLTGLGHKIAWEIVNEAVRIGAESHGGIHSILLDGAADLVADVNDAEESNAFVASLHNLGIRHDCPIDAVIHFNPGSDKSRGHLGSQLERKAETNLALEKDGAGITTIFSVKNRRAPIPKDIGPRFQWSDEAQSHVSIQNRQATKEEIEKETLTALAVDTFKDKPAMRYTDILVTVKRHLTVSEKTAERKVRRMHKLGVIKKTVAGLYERTT